MTSKLDMIEGEMDWIDDERRRLQKEKDELMDLYCKLYHEVEK